MKLALTNHGPTDAGCLRRHAVTHIVVEEEREQYFAMSIEDSIYQIRSRQSRLHLANPSTPSRHNHACSQRIEKRDQGFPISRGQIKAKRMSFDSANFYTGSSKACRYVVIAQTPRVKPIFQSRYRTIVLKWASIPHPLE